MATTRRQAREWAIQILSAADLNPIDSTDDLLASFWAQLKTLDDEDGGEVKGWAHGKTKAFAQECVVGVRTHLDEIDAILAPLLKDWDLDRLGTVERAVLRLGVWELKYSDVPHAVVINEALDLANWFSTPKSRAFINGVLDAYAKSLEK